jgi:hypothetical protein
MNKTRDNNGRFIKIEDDTDVKVCTRCKIEKKLDEYHKGNSSKGRKSKCKECFNELSREKYKETFVYDEKQKEKQRNRWINRDVELIKEKYRNYKRNKIKTDNLFKLKINISSSIKKCIVRKSKKTNEILGCSYDFLKSYLESKFEPWMTWDNYGLYTGETNIGWDIDHIIPLSSAKTEEEIVKLNHYTNLQPLCSYINRYIKKDKII